MVQFKNQEKEIIFKIVYYGPALGGKTTNLEMLHKITDPEGKTKLTSLKTSEDRTLFFDLLPFDLGEIQGYRIRIQVYTVPGQVHYNTTRRIVLAGADAIIFVADSQIQKLDENKISFENMKANLIANKMKFDEVPTVIQCNKIDLENIAPKREVLSKMNLKEENYEVISASAINGTGVVETFRKTVSKSLAVFSDKFKLYQKGVTAQKLEESVKRLFEPFEKIKIEPLFKNDKKLEAILPLKGLSEEEQLITALKSTTEIAEKYNEVELINNLYKEKIKEMTFFYELQNEANSFKNGSEFSVWAFDRVANFKPDFFYTLLRCSEKKIELIKTHYLEKDPLLMEGNTAAGNFIFGIAGKRETMRLDELPSRLTELTGRSSNVPETVFSLFLGDCGDYHFTMLIYSQHSEKLTSNVENFFKHFGGIVNSKISIIKLLNELQKMNNDLERKVAERTSALSRALEDLKELDNAKRAFLNSVSHEIKTPLSNIKSQSDFLFRHPEMWFEKGKEYLQMIKKDSEKLEELFETMLSFSYVKEPYKGEQINIVDVLNYSLASLKTKIKAKEIEVKVETDSEQIIYPINRKDAEIIFNEVIENAVKFSPQKEKIKIFLFDDGERVTFSVRDFGEGFSKESRALLFEPAIQGTPEAPSFVGGGLGMGLFFVREIIKKYGGTISIDDMKPGANVLVEFSRLNKND